VNDASDTQLAAADASASGEGEGDGQGLAPFASWSMNSNSRGVTMFHHQFKTALPVFTPDPPILRAKFPEPARGKDIVIEIVINDQGAIQQATVLQGIGYGVEESIMQTLRQWIFVPAKVNGMPIASQRQLRFHFPG
jgi:TonB family protein